MVEAARRRAEEFVEWALALSTEGKGGGGDRADDNGGVSMARRRGAMEGGLAKTVMAAREKTAVMKRALAELRVA